MDGAADSSMVVDSDLTNDMVSVPPPPQHVELTTVAAADQENGTKIRSDPDLHDPTETSGNLGSSSSLPPPISTAEHRSSSTKEQEADSKSTDNKSNENTIKPKDLTTEEATIATSTHALNSSGTSTPHLQKVNAPQSTSLPPLSPTPTSPTAGTRELGKRKSPWREPRNPNQLPPPAKDIVKDHHSHGKLTQEELEQQQRKEQRRKLKKWKRQLMASSITVSIPLSVTADLGMVIPRIRNKRIQAAREMFPEYFKDQNVQLNRSSDAAGTDTNRTIATKNEDGEQVQQSLQNGSEQATKKKNGKSKSKKIPKHIPQPHEYASVLDYLEAKYVQGVTIDDSDDPDGNVSGGGGDDEGTGSVYSESSFLDDSGLQRNVAEQILGRTTTTKLELAGKRKGDNDDEEDVPEHDDFFVNVGELEVEENDWTQEHYDPLEDTKKSFKIKKTRKRKTPATPDDENDHTLKKKKKKKLESSSADIQPEEPKKKKKKISTAENAARSPDTKIKKEKVVTPKKQSNIHDKDDNSSNASKGSQGNSKSAKDPKVLKLQKKSTAHKANMESLFQACMDMINSFTEEQLPRRAKPKKVRVSLTCPANKAPGDFVTFANPHNPTQKLRVKIPPNTEPGKAFKVSVPKPPDEDEEDLDPKKDYNKLTRDFYELLDDYARSFDDWCDAEGEYQEALGKKYFPVHFTKREKWDKFGSAVPKDLKTPLNKPYLQKLQRRARQLKHKRKQAQVKSNDDDSNNNDEETGMDNSSNVDDSDKSVSEDDGRKRAGVKLEHTKPAAEKIPKKTKKTIVVPVLSRIFSKKQIQMEDFKV